MSKAAWRESVWTTKDGTELELWQMNTYHLCNTLAMLRRNGFISLDEMTLIFSASPLSMDSAAGRDYQRACQEAGERHSTMVDLMERELKHRNKFDVYQKHYAPDE